MEGIGSFAANAAMNAAGNYVRQQLNKRQRTITDQTSYQQWKRYDIRGGKKRPRTMPLLKANIVRLDYTFKFLKSFVGNGALWMDNYQLPTGPIIQPLYTLLLNGCNQRTISSGTGVYTQPLRRYVRQSDGYWTSETINGQAPDGSLSTYLFPAGTNLGNVLGSSIGVMGPKGYLNWTSVKLNLWGAKFKQVIYYIDIVAVDNPSGNPYRYSPNTALPEDLNQHLDEIMRPLTVNPLADANNLVPSPWRVIKRIKVEFDPIVTTEGDQDPHCKTLNIFNRWGRTIDFNDSTTSVLPADDDNVNYVNVAKGITDGTVGVIDHIPSDDQMLFMVIRSSNFVVRADPAEVTNGLTPSFDIKFRSSWSKLSV